MSGISIPWFLYPFLLPVFIWHFLKDVKRWFMGENIHRSLYPPVDFHSDGCSGGLSKLWKKVFGELPPFETACREHDLEYYWGGSYGNRLYADLVLARNVVVMGTMSVEFPWHPIAFLLYFLLAIVVFVVVQIGGASHWKRPYSWDFGWHPEWLGVEKDC